jgi:polar amino acid transport system substrate-binding protein
MTVLRYLVCATLWAAQCGPAEAQTCTKTVRWFDDAPYSFRAASGEIQGLYVDIARVALKQMGCEAHFVEMPWARALAEMEQGRLDILPGALRKPERETFAFFSRPTNRSPNVLFVSRVAARRFHIRQLSDLIGTDFRLGAQIDVSYGASYDALIKNPDFKSHLSPLTMRRSAWKMVERDRIDGVIADEVTDLLELRQLGLSETISRTRVVVSGEPAMFAFSKKSVDRPFVAAFDNAFGAMLADGRYKELAQRYLPCAISVENLGCK